jgi:hypothetical protein
VAVLVVVLAGAAALVYALTRPSPTPRAQTQPATVPSTQPQTAPATQAAAKAPPKPKGPTTQYLDVAQTNYPRLAQTQPMGVPLDLAQAARLTFKEPVYLSPRGDLWITRADAPPTETVLARAAKEQGDQLALTVREEVVFAHWQPRDNGPWTFNLIARRPGGGGYELVNQSGRKPVGAAGRVYHWERALDWNEKVVVATDTGVSIFQFEPQVTEQHIDLAPTADGATPPANLAEPQFLLDWQGVLAWLPWERGKTGGRGAARYVDGNWTALGPDQGWPEKLLHLMPLLDGSVLQIIAKDADQVQVSLASVQQLKIDEAVVAKQVEALSDPDEIVRQNAYQELTRYGPSIAPVLEKLVKDQDPEAQARLRQLIKSQVEPTLGGMTLLGDQLRVAARLSDGGAVFYAEAGVMIPGDNDTPTIRTPAWLSIRPGQAVELLDPPLTIDLNPDRSRIYAFGSEWIVTNDVRGPQRFVGNGFVPLLRRSEVAKGFSEPLGIDRHGRWLFRKVAKADPVLSVPAPAPQQPGGPPGGPAVPGGPPGPVQPPPGPQPPATAPAPPATGPAVGPLARATTTTALAAPADGAKPAGAKSTGDSPEAGDAGPGATLIIDPTLPDPTPRLPVWVYTTAVTVGWDKDNWPVIKSGGAWALEDDGWRPLKSKDKMFTKPEEAPPPAPAAAAQPAAPGATSAPATTSAATSPATTQAEDLGPALLQDPDGNRYYDGRDALKVRTRAGKRIDWPLPPTATGGGLGGKIFLVRANDGLLFLFNQPGRVVRIRPTPDGEQPFEVDATFTRNIPSSDAVARVWLDPAGRIIMAYEARLAIMFPAGYIPRAIGQLMPPAEAEAEEL